jgi:hypothetical protein
MTDSKSARVFAVIDSFMDLLQKAVESFERDHSIIYRQPFYGILRALKGLFDESASTSIDISRIYDRLWDLMHRIIVVTGEITSHASPGKFGCRRGCFNVIEGTFPENFNSIDVEVSGKEQALLSNSFHTMSECMLALSSFLMACYSKVRIFPTSCRPI